MKVYEALAKAFAEEGTSTVFGMMGNTTLHWIDALEKLGVRVFEVRHEGPGLAMAEGMHAIDGSVGVVTTTSGPGVTQLATTMVVAARSKTPLVAFCGDTRWGDEEDTQKFDLARFAAAVECEFVRVTSAEHAYEATQHAFFLARSQSRPVMLSAPLDVQMQEIDDDEEYTPSSVLLSTYPAYPHPDAMKKAVDIVAGSTRPVIIVGRGAVTSGAGEVITRLAERIGAIVATSVMALNWPGEVGEYHVGISGLFSTRSAIELFQESDCVIGVGASLNRYTTEHGYLYPDATYIQIDTAKQITMGDGRIADCFIQADAKVGLEVLEEQLKERSFSQVGYRTEETRELLSHQMDDPVTYELEPGLLDPREVLRTLDEIIPPEIGIVISGSHSAQMALMGLRKPRKFLVTNKNFGSMSKGIAAVIGAATSTKEPTVLLEGDVGFMMHAGEFDTAVRYKLPIFVIIMNDEAMGTELHQALGHEGIDTDLTLVQTPDLGQVGVALGGRGRLVRTIEDFRAAAAEFLADPVATIIDVRISTKVQSIPVRRLQGRDEV